MSENPTIERISELDFLETIYEFEDELAQNRLDHITYSSITAMQTDETLNPGDTAIFNGAIYDTLEVTEVEDETDMTDPDMIYLYDGTYYKGNSGEEAAGFASENGFVVVSDKNTFVTPEMFGAVGDGVTDDTQAIIATLQAVADSQTTTSNESDTLAVWFSKRYKLTAPVYIPSGLANLHIIGSAGSSVNGYGFTFDENTGHDVLIENLTMIGCHNPFKFIARNLEYTNIEFRNCIFRNCTGISLDINRRSSRTLINECFFKGCEREIKLTDVDMANVSGCWFEHSTVETTTYYCIEQSAPNEGFLECFNNIFVPAVAQTVSAYWIRTGKDANITANRFSGEHDGTKPLLIEFDRLASFSINSTHYPIVNFTDNPSVDGSPRIEIGEFKGCVNIQRNSGYINGAKILTVKSGTETFIDGLTVADLMINIKDNTGRGANNRYYLVTGPYDPVIDDRLVRFITAYHWAKTSASKYIINVKPEIIVDGGKLTIRLPYMQTYLAQMHQWSVMANYLVMGTANPQPSGSGYYRRSFAGILTFDIGYVDGSIRILPVYNPIGTPASSLTFTAKINGNENMTFADANAALQADGHIDLELEITGTNANVYYAACTSVMDMSMINNYKL